MSNELFQFNFEHDQQSTENQYPISDVQWIYINDINVGGNYSNGFINFTNVSVIGNSVEKQYLWSQGYLAIPYTITVVPAAGMTFNVDDANVNALSIKSYATMIDWVSAKFNGVSVTRNSYYNHLMMNERIKTYNSDKYKLHGDIMCHEWDTGNALSYSATIGERNNNTLPLTSLVTGMNPANIVNEGHLSRCSKTNIDVTNTANSSLASFFGTGCTTLRDTGNQNALVFNTVDGLCYQGTAIIALSELHDFFKQMPSVASSTGFELRLQSNLSRENSYVTKYGAIAAGSTTPNIPIEVTSQQIVGHCCPFLLALPSGGAAAVTGPPVVPSTWGSTGLSINNTALIAANSTITVKACIGWMNNTGQLTTQFAGVSSNPCRIFLPAINYNSNYIKSIIQSPQYSLKYMDYYVDMDEGKVQNSQVSRLFNVQLSRVRTLYIIPFLSATTSFPSPFNSIISSAPITCTPCRLKNFNIQIGGSNIFTEPQNFNYQFYNNNALSIMADVNGNSLKSKFFSGQITKSMWENGYNVYSINLEKVTDEITDSLMKSFQLIFQVEDSTFTPAANKLKYDFYYMITYQSELNLDRSTGTITNGF
jgi:hypothetical protein